MQTCDIITYERDEKMLTKAMIQARAKAPARRAKSKTRAMPKPTEKTLLRALDLAIAECIIAQQVLDNVVCKRRRIREQISQLTSDRRKNGQEDSLPG